MKELIEEVNELLGMVEDNPQDLLLMNRLTKALKSLGSVCKMTAALQDAIPRMILEVAVKTTGVLGSIETNLDISQPIAIAIGMLGDLNSLADDNIVQQVVDAVKAHAESVAVLEKGSAALGKISLQSWPLLKMVGAAGGVELLCGVSNGDDMQKKQAVSGGLGDVETAFLNSLEEIGDDPIGLRIFKDLLSSGVEPVAGGLLGKVAASENGLAFLLKFLSTNEFKSCSAEVQGRIVAQIASMLSQDPSAAKVQVDDPETLQLLVNLLDNKALQPAVLQLLAVCVFSIELVVEESFADHALKVFQLLDVDAADPEASSSVLFALLPFSEESSVLEKLRAEGAPVTVLAVLQKHERDARVVEPGVKLMKRLTKDQDLKALGLTAAAMAFFSSLVAAQGIDPNLQTLGQETREETTELVQQMQGAFGETDTEQLETSFTRLPEVLERSTKLRETEEGKYENEETKEVFEKAPQEVVEEHKAVAEVTRLATPMEERVPEMPTRHLRDTVDFFKKHSAEPVRLVTLANALESLATNRKNRDTMAKAGLLEALATGLKRKSVEKEFVVSAVVLVARFATNQELKETLIGMEIIQVLVGILQRFIKDALVVEKVLLALSNLTFKNETAVEQVVKYSGIEQVKSVMNLHANNAKVIRFACILLVNVMYGSDHRKLFVGQVMKEEVADTLQHKYQDAKLYIALARVVGNIACVDEHIRWFVENSGVKAIVAAMSYHEDDKEVQQVSIDVLGNFASLTEGEEEEEAVKQGSIESVLDYIIVEGGARKILDICMEEVEERVTETFLLLSGFKTLVIMANSSYLATRLIKMGVIEVALGALQQFDTDLELADVLAQLLAALAFYDIGVEELEKQDGVGILLVQLDAHSEEPEVVECVLETLKYMAKKPAVQTEIVQQEGVETVFKSLEVNLKEPRVVEESLELFVRLSTVEAHATRIGQKGMRIIFNVFKEYKEDTEILVIAYRLLGLLAFAKENLNAIVQYQGHELLIASILAHPENSVLVTRSVKTLDNISMTSTENSTIVSEAGGAKVLEEVLRAYAKDEDAATLVAACKSALLSMKVVDKGEYGDGTAAKMRRAKSFKEVTEVTEDPLKKYRAVLQSGSEFKVWSGSSYKKRYMRICKLVYVFL